MTPPEASAFIWHDVAAPVAGFVMAAALVLLGFALLREITR